MKSPFPGMDPYIEERGLWETFHVHLIAKILDSLEQLVPDRYVVRAGERAYIVLTENGKKKEHSFLPDVGVLSPTSPVAQTALAEKTTPVIAADPVFDGDPVSMRAFVATEYRESFIEIYVTEPDRQLATSIEVLSPSNKRPNTPGWDLYQRKRKGMLLGAANLVEIDLLRGGERMPMLDSWPKSPYTILVSRRTQAPDRRVWPANFKRPLRTIPIPLLSPDADVPLDLQPMIDTVYARSHYDRDIKYDRPLSPPLTAEESTWLAEQLRKPPSP
jgi:hypothetical protein